MKYYLKWSKKNFGDELNDLIFPELGYANCLHFNKKNLLNLDSNTVLGLGTLLLKKINSPITVAGAGSDGIEKPKGNLNYIFVRGKLTTEFLNLPTSMAIGDPAYFLNNYFHSKKHSVTTREIGIVPHWTTLENFNDPNIISPHLPVDEFIREVSKCKILLCEAMHGAICADILRIPFAPVKIGKSFNEFKWLDWASTMNLNLDFGNLKNYKLTLSKDKDLEKTVNLVTEKLEELRC